LSQPSENFPDGALEKKKYFFLTKGDGGSLFLEKNFTPFLTVSIFAGTLGQLSLIERKKK
jgi:hypothetical protein